MRPRKFEDLLQSLEKRILDGALKPGEALPSQSQLCESFSLSRSCVQKALDALAEKRLVESFPGKGVYVRGAKPDEAFARKFKNVALVFHQEFRLETHPQDNFGLEMLWGVEEELRKFGANCIVRKRGRSDSFSGIIPEMEGIGADAFIMDREFSDDQLRPLLALGKPVASLGRLCALPFVSSALPNHADSFFRVFVRMADEGFHGIAMLCLGGHYEAELLWAMSQAAAARPGAKFSHQELRCPLGSADGGLEEALEALLSEAKPDALAIPNDWQAARVLELLAKHGVEGVSVLGCFDLALCAECRPALSSMAVDAREIGRRAVRLLAASALDGAPPGVEKVPFALVERESFKWPSGKVLA